MNPNKITVIDYKLSNIFSVKHAFERLGCEVEISTERKDVENSEALVLPGVGAFGEAMSNLAKLDLIHPIQDYIKSGKPFFGVCLGMQLLFEESSEFGTHKGLGIIDGNIHQFTSVNGLKIPQVCWKKIQPCNTDSFGKTPFDGISNGDYMYFVHSYFAKPSNLEDVLSISNFGDMEYCSSIFKGNIVATQFHPEKSGDAGLSIYKNWVDKIKESTYA